MKRGEEVNGQGGSDRRRNGVSGCVRKGELLSSSCVVLVGESSIFTEVFYRTQADFIPTGRDKVESEFMRSKKVRKSEKSRNKR